MSKEGDKLMEFQRAQRAKKKPVVRKPFAMGWGLVKPKLKPKPEGATK